VTILTESKEQPLARFAAKYNLRVQCDECNDPIILGKHGHLYEYSPTEVGLMILPLGGNPRPRLWNSTREKCIAAGMTLRQNGDAEGALSFDPANQGQAKLAIRVAGARPKRQLSNERRQAQAAILVKARQARRNSIKQGSPEAFFGPEGRSAGETMAFMNLDRKTPVSIDLPVPAVEAAS
jgi:hypothetical protein